MRSDSGRGSLEKGGLLPSGQREAMSEDGLREAADGDFLRFACGVGVLQERELLLSFIGLVENGFKFFASVAAGFMMGECGGDNPAQVLLSALKI